MQQVAVFGRKQENQPIDEPQQLAEKLGQRQRAVEAFSRSAVIGVPQKAIAEAEQRRLNAIAQAVAGSDAFLLPGVAPAFERRSPTVARGGRNGSRERAATVPRNRQRHPLENRAKIGLDIGGAGEAGIVAHEPKKEAVGAKPQRRLPRHSASLAVRRRPSVGGLPFEVLARPVEIVGRRDHHDRNASAETFKRDRELPVTDRACPHTLKIGEAEHVAQKLFDKIDRRGSRWGFAHDELLERGLADTEVPRDLIPQREPLRNTVIGIGLSSCLMGRSAPASPTRSVRLRR